VTDSSPDPLNPQHRLEGHLRHIVNLLEKHRLVETMVERNRATRSHPLIESLVHRQHLVELQLKLRGLHPADIAYVLEALSAGKPAVNLDADSG
jgi:magnesium transporter